MHLRPPSSPSPAFQPHWRQTWPALALAAPGQPTDSEFAALVVACRGSGGLARGDDLARLLRERGSGDFTSLARQIVGGEVFSFRWHDDFWVPLFQFHGHSLAVQPALARVLAVLGPGLDGAALAAWFTRAHRRLGGATPAERLEADEAGVLAAAHGDAEFLQAQTDTTHPS